MDMIGGFINMSFWIRFIAAMAILFFVKGSKAPDTDFAEKSIKVLIAAAIVVAIISVFIRFVFLFIGLGGLHHGLFYGIYH